MIEAKDAEKNAAYLRDYIDENGHLWDDCQIEKMKSVAEFIEVMPEIIEQATCFYNVCSKLSEWDAGGDNADLLASAVEDARGLLCV